VKIENVRVTAKSDGGLPFQPDPARRCLYPVISIEVLPPIPTVRIQTLTLLDQAKKTPTAQQ
jgi:hypothetical protein